jgi:hypothetical protein
MVAETIMKKLYNRNKELEKWYEESKQTPIPGPSPSPSIPLKATALAPISPARTELSDFPRTGDVPSDIIQSMKDRQTELEEELRVKDEQLLKVTQ